MGGLSKIERLVNGVPENRGIRDCESFMYSRHMSAERVITVYVSYTRMIIGVRGGAFCQLNGMATARARAAKSWTS